MIFVTLGTQNFPFDRLVKKINEYCLNGELNENVIIQGRQVNIPDKSSLIVVKELIKNEEMTKLIRDASVVITHAGTGTILACENSKRPYILVPRLRKFEEHIDDHQLEIADVFQEKGDAKVVLDINLLKDEIKCIKNIDVNSLKYYTSNNEQLKIHLLNTVRKIIN